MERFILNLQEAERLIQIADHMTYITYPLIKEKNILLKILTETKKAVANCINSILQYEYFYKQITLYNNPKTNLETFIKKSSKRFQITELEIKQIQELFELAEKHKQSPMEFTQNEKVIIMTENSETYELSLEKAKLFVSLSKNILQKTKNKIFLDEK